MTKLNILIFGATGSIGDSFFDIIRDNKDKFEIHGITCNRNIEKIRNLAKEFNVKKIGISEYKKEIDYKKKFNDKELFFGLNEFSNLIDKNVDIIIFAISGLSSLELSLKIAASGKTIGLANKECIISLGKIFLDKAQKSNSRIIPLDSEHNSVYQILKKNNIGVKKIILTASGGPFLYKKIDELKDVKPNEALKHPIWRMGKKISIDSATMMNKALELIEAKYLFNLKNNEIDALIHPEAILHGLVSYIDNSMIGFMSRPDMRIPISNLLSQDDYITNDNLEINLGKIGSLNFHEIDNHKFPIMNYCRDILDLGGLAPSGLNYINEKLVYKFLSGKIGFLEIINYNIETLDKFFANNNNIESPNIDDIKNFHNWIDKNIYTGK